MRAATSSARCIAGPTTCSGAADRRAALRRRPVPEPAQLPAADLERPGVRRQPSGATSRPTSPASARDATSTSPATCSTSVELHECDYNWKTFIEVYLEDYHVDPFHPGLGHFVTCDDLRWEFGAHHSVQTVGVNNALGKAGLAGLPQVARRGARITATASRPSTARSGSPTTRTIMVEWYPHVLVGLDAVSARARRRRSTSSSSTTPRRSRVRARVRRGRAGRVHGNLRRGRRDRAAHGRRPARAVRARRRRGRPVPVADGRRHAAFPRVV